MYVLVQRRRVCYIVQRFRQLSPANMERRRSAETKKQCWNKNMMDSWDGDDNDDVDIMIVMLTMLKWWWQWWQWWPWQWFWQQETEIRPWDAANLWVPSNPDHYERLGTCHKTPPTHTIMAKLSNVDEAAPKPWYETCLREKNCSVFLDYRSAIGADDFGGADDDLVKIV